ncbi:MAG: bifunctional riboflavin kinase/FAD synthetase [Porticoccaceae bacterium]
MGSKLGSVIFTRDPRKLRLGGRRSVVTIGSFDGVHRGHQTILEQVRSRAEELDIPAVAVTFEPQPREYFSPQQAPARLMRMREKIQSLLNFGMHYVVCLQFNSKLRDLTAEQFVQLVLVDGLATKQLIVGDDFRFGCDRTGDFNTLMHMGKTLDFQVWDTPTLVVDGERVSSTRVRKCLECGDFQQVARLIGRPFAISGRVFHGQHLGRELGFPTANVQLNRYRAPLSGVYAVLVQVEGCSQQYRGAANVGVRPTVGDLIRPILEVHLLDFDQNLYGRRINVEFLHKIRDEQKFTSVEHLVSNIRVDIEKITNWFDQAGRPDT